MLFRRPPHKVSLVRSHRMSLLREVKTTRNMLAVAYEKLLVQSQLWSFSSQIAACIGFLVILAGLVAILLARETVSGLIAATSGITICITSGLLFRQARGASEQANNTIKLLILLTSDIGDREVTSVLPPGARY